MTIERIQSPVLSAPHGFFGRTGGVSTGDLASLNCGIGSGDDPALVDENRRRALAAVAPGSTLVAPYQTHSAICLTVTDPWPDTARPEGDALVTDRPGLALSILTADCAPVLFVDAQAGIVGAAHAGWKGALGGVTDATIDAMEALGADRARIAAAIGPCIARASYEVDDAFAQRFEAEDPANEQFFGEGRAGHRHFDLEAYVAHRLRCAGVERVALMGLDTYSNPGRYFSFRRATHTPKISYGRQISVIAV